MTLDTNDEGDPTMNTLKNSLPTHQALTIEVIPMRGKFPLHETLATIGACAVMKSNRIDPATLLERHQSGDWGDVRDDTREQNESALAASAFSYRRFFSIYPTENGGVLWVITDAKHTVILTPGEY